MKKLICILCATVLMLIFSIGCIGCDEKSVERDPEKSVERDPEKSDTPTTPSTPEEETKESITLSASTLKIKVNEQAVLSATVMPLGTNVIWKSDNRDVAVVSSDGIVIGLSAGMSTVTASTVSGKASAQCVVTVIEVDPPAPSLSVVISKSELEMSIGDTYQLSAMVSPSDKNSDLTWSSSNEAVVTVKNGLLTALSAGSAFIQAKAGNATAVCTVEVKEAFGSISGTITCRNHKTGKDEVDLSTGIYLISDSAKDVWAPNILMGRNYDNHREDGIYWASVDSVGNFSIENIKLGNYRMIITCSGKDFNLGYNGVSCKNIKDVFGSLFNRISDSDKATMKQIEESGQNLYYNNQMSGFNVKVGKNPLKISRNIAYACAGSDVK